MANKKHLFEDFCLDQAEQQVRGINNGLVIAGQGTMVIMMNNNIGRPHKIKIPNSLYLPEVRVCLQLPQHWAQEARDNYYPLPNGTRIEINAIPFDLSMNSPIFYMLPSISFYQAFVSTFQALKAPFFRREHVFQFPDWHMLDGDPPPEEEFMVEENVH
jgi:hypothetical protein